MAKMLRINNANLRTKIIASNLDDKEVKILQAIPKKGIVDISDLSGNTLFSPSTVKNTIAKLEHDGVIISKKELKNTKSIKGRSIRSNFSMKGRIKHNQNHSETIQKIIEDDYKKGYELSRKGRELKNLLDNIILQ